MIKKLLCLILTLSFLFTVSVSMTSCGKKSQMDIIREQLLPLLEGDYTNNLAGTTLYVYNWGEYISDGEDDTLDVNLAFEAVTGIHVEYSTFDSNESMYANLAGGGVSYDVLIPSDYMISRLIKEGYLQKIDTSKLSNYKYIDQQFLNPEYDPTSEYSVPYTVGYVGVIYNNTLVDAEDVDGTWSLLWNEKYAGQILGFDNARDAFMEAQCALGLDINSEDTSTWDQAAEYLSKAVPLYQSWVMDQIFAKMEGENAAIACYYVGDYLTMVEDMNEAGLDGSHLSFYYPSEGTNVFSDACCITANCQNYEAALLYINFLNDPVVALANAEYIHYASPNTSVYLNPEYSEYGNTLLYPESVKSSYYKHLSDETVSYYENLFNKIKSSAK